MRPSYLGLQYATDVGVMLIGEGLGDVEQVYPVIGPHRSCGFQGFNYIRHSTLLKENDAYRPLRNSIKQNISIFVCTAGYYGA